MKKLNYKILNDIDFKNEDNFLQTVLNTRGVEDVESFLNPTIEHTHSPFLLKNMEEGLHLLHKNLGKKIFLKVDADVDGFTSAAYMYQFLKAISPETEIVWQLNFEKVHGLSFNNLNGYEDVAVYQY